MAGGLVVVAGAVLTVVLLTASRPGPAAVTPGALITTFQPGELRQVPDACHAVPAATVQRYLPGKAKVASPLPVNGSAESACNWTIDKPPLYRLMELNLLAYAPNGLASGNGSATFAATDAYDLALQDMQAPPKHSPAPPATVRVLSGFGNQAFSALQVYRVGGAVTAEKKAEESLEDQRQHGFFGLYAWAAKYSIEHRWKFFFASLLFLAAGVLIFSRLSTSFFPEDVQYWSYIDVWLPNDANFGATNETALKAEQIVREQAARFSKEYERQLKQRNLLRYLTTFVGGGGPRFWFSASPQGQQLNYAQVLIEVSDKEMTPAFIKQLQPVLTSSIPGARLDARQLLTNPMDYPIEIRVSSTADVSAQEELEDIRGLRAAATKVEDILRSIPIAERTRNEWEEASAQIALTVDPDRANLAGITNMDVANSSTAGISGSTVGVLQEGQKQIPIVARLRMDERAQLSDIQDLYVYGSQDSNKIKLAQISNIDHDLVTGRIVRLEQFRTINVRSFPIAGHLSSEVLKAAMPRLNALEATLPPGYKIQIGGEYDKTKNGFRNLAMVMVISVAAVFLALVFQFKNAIKPTLVLAAAPYGMIGAFAALWIMGEPFGFMAFLGVASLVGVIVSHSIVLFDFIEERRIAGDDFELALIDAGILRLRPVLITVFATVLALVPLAVHGGPLWKPLCYAQIGGLLVATVVTKLQVPVMYAIFVLDLKILKWGVTENEPIAQSNIT